MAIQRILVAYDGSDAARRAAQLAGELARALGATVTVLKAGQAIIPTGQGIVPSLEEGPHEAVAEEGRRLVAEQGVQADRAFRWGEPALEIVAAARDLQADLIVVGHGDQPKLRKLILGSVASAVVNRAPCPVLVAK